MGSGNGLGQKLKLNGARVLLVEDEYYIADDIKKTLLAAGASVVGPVSTLAGAHALVDQDEFDCAVIDLNLHGESAVPIAEKLTERGKSFAIATGFGSAAVPEHLRNVPRIEKPFDPSALIEVFRQLGCVKFL